MVVQHVTVSGRNMDCGTALGEFVTTHLETLSQKYFGRLLTCRVVFTKNPKGHSFSCHIQVVIGHNMFYASEATFDNVHAAFNQAYEHLAKQMRRKKRQLHEDKPDRLKETVLNELSIPDRVNSDATPLTDDDEGTEPLANVSDRPNLGLPREPEKE
jgi:ribosomal subunit interface protein